MTRFLQGIFRFVGSQFQGVKYMLYDYQKRFNNCKQHERIQFKFQIEKTNASRIFEKILILSVTANLLFAILIDILLNDYTISTYNLWVIRSLLFTVLKDTDYLELFLVETDCLESDN